MNAVMKHPRTSHAVLSVAVVPCSLGFALIASSEKGICAMLLGDDESSLRDDLRRRFPKSRFVEGDADFRRLTRRVIDVLERPSITSDLPLDIHGTAFQMRVWNVLRTIPPGETANYAEVARRIGKPTAARAVAQACACNPVAVVVPCHRVVGSDGSLAGFRWGVHRKAKMLEREGVSRGA